MTTEEILGLIAQGEGQGIEFKRSLAELETGVRTVAAMANANGGHVIFGVRDGGTILGVQIGAQTKERVMQAITGNTDPILYPSVDYVDVDGKTIIVVAVAESDNKPHLAYGQAYKRVGAATRRMDRAEYERLRFQRRRIGFDHQLVEGATHADLDEARLEWYIRQRALGHAASDAPVHCSISP